MSLHLTQFDEVISLGGFCWVKYQISLNQYRRATGAEYDARAFERALYAHNKEVLPAGNDFFDWLVTPASALMYALNEGLVPIFEKDRLVRNASGSIQDRSSGVIFHHAFTKNNGAVAAETLEAEYPKQRAKIEYLADKFLRRLRSPTRTLYVRSDAVMHEAGLDAVSNFVKYVARVAPEHKFHVVFVPLVSTPRGTLSSCGGVTVHELSGVVEKPPVARWQGSDHHWQPFLDTIDLASASGRRVDKA